MVYRDQRNEKKTQQTKKKKSHTALPYPKTLSRCGCGFSSPLIFLPSRPFTLLCIIASQMLLFVTKSRINTHFQASSCISTLSAFATVAFRTFDPQRATDIFQLVWKLDKDSQDFRSL